mgnify:CR=1 FL=1
MKKFLLLALIMFSMNSFAQNPRTLLMAKKSEPVKTVKFNSQRSLKDIIGSENLKPAAKAPAKAPEGTKSAYYMDCYQSVYGLNYLCNKNHVYSEIIITSDGKAYISNMFYTDLLGKELYLEGKVNADGSIEIGYQNLTTYQGISLYVSCVNPNTGDADKTSTFKLSYNKDYNAYISDEESYLGVYVENSGNLNLDTYCCYLSYLPENAYPEATKHSYSFVDKNNNTQNTTVDMIDLGDNYFYINNIMPGYENVWLVCYIDNNGMNIYSYQLAADNCAFSFVNQDGTLEDGAILAYNSSDKTYKLSSDLMFVDVFYDDGSVTGTEGLSIATNILSNMSIGASATGIDKVENGNENVVSTNYYDLSGRRINNAYKGISIKVMKYADGTSKAVKVMK